MNLEEARKQVQAPKKIKENFLAIKVSYDCTLILPYKDGIAFMATLQAAEQLDESYSSKHRIQPLTVDKISARPFSNQEYERYKMAALLCITVSELEMLEQEELQKTEPKE